MFQSKTNFGHILMCHLKTGFCPQSSNSNLQNVANLGDFYSFCSWSSNNPLSINGGEPQKSWKYIQRKPEEQEWIQRTIHFRSSFKGIRGKLGSGGERSEPTDQSTPNSNSASKADNFSFFKYVARRSGSDFRISALFSLVHVSLSTDLVLVSLQ